MKRERIAILIIGLLIQGCVNSENSTPSLDYLPTVTISPTLSIETSPAEPTPTVVIPTPVYTPEPCDTAHPEFFYVNNGKLYKFEDCIKIEIPVELPIKEKILDIALLDQQLIVVTGGGVHKVDIETGVKSEVVEFIYQVLGCQIILSADLANVIYACNFDDPEAEFSIGTLIGVYNVKDGIIQELPVFHRMVHIIGMSQNGKEIYGIPFGQDPDFRSVLRIELKSQQVIGEFNVVGNNLAALSGDHQFLATTENTHRNEIQTSELYINIYDLSKANDILLKDSELPVIFGFVNNFIWGTGDELILLIKKGKPWNSNQIHGEIWKYFRAGGDWRFVAGIKGRGAFIESVDPTGRWLLIRFEMDDGALLIDLEQRRIFKIDIPAGSFFFRLGN